MIITCSSFLCESTSVSLEAQNYSPLTSCLVWLYSPLAPYTFCSGIAMARPLFSSNRQPSCLHSGQNVSRLYRRQQSPPLSLFFFRCLCDSPVRSFVLGCPPPPFHSVLTPRVFSPGRRPERRPLANYTGLSVFHVLAKALSTLMRIFFCSHRAVTAPFGLHLFARRIFHLALLGRATIPHHGYAHFALSPQCSGSNLHQGRQVCFSNRAAVWRFFFPPGLFPRKYNRLWNIFILFYLPSQCVPHLIAEYLTYIARMNFPDGAGLFRRPSFFLADNCISIKVAHFADSGFMLDVHRCRHFRTPMRPGGRWLATAF